MDHSSQEHNAVHASWAVLKYIYGFAAILVGVDKFLHMTVDWNKYLSPLIVENLPISLTHFWYIIGIIEIAVGLLILSKYTKEGAYILTAWFGVIILNLLTTHHYDIIVRDVLAAVGSYVLARLSEVVRPHTVKNPY